MTAAPGLPQAELGKYAAMSTRASVAPFHAHVRACHQLPGRLPPWTKPGSCSRTLGRLPQDAARSSGPPCPCIICLRRSRCAAAGSSALLLTHEGKRVPGMSDSPPGSCCPGGESRCLVVAAGQDAQ